ncbi:vitellogenin-1-like [Sitodiplosis mosellana]|uniref:vitellogenin-1-like n=1 Tax=Sitodiplosis mosellana TaxID=263140 RepID=UPI00244395AC|nr:vitellogenin-1-like [Sitodiplosis mosellana]
MNYVLKIKDQSIAVPLSEPLKLLSLKEFDSKFPLVIMITGWTTNTNKPINHALDVIYAAYRCRGHVNFVSIDTGRFIDTLYTWSAVNTEEIGKIIADSLKDLIKRYPVEKIHLIGHSLGAHIGGSIGQNLKIKSGKTLPRITALDPANPCFNSETDLKGLTRYDAKLVDVIHTNPGGLGKRDPIGAVDFYVNGLFPHPPGCFTMICAHLRAADFYAESVYPGNERNFLSIECGALLTLNTHYCSKNEYPMGYALPQNIGGIFYLNTNEESPYGMNVTKDFKPVCIE